LCIAGSAQQTTAKTTAVAKATSAAKAPSSGGKSYKASFTQYGSTDTWGSGNCNVKTTACGFYTTGKTGYNAAVSQNEFGVGPVRLKRSLFLCIFG